jgi:hypothetical protein
MWYGLLSPWAKRHTTQDRTECNYRVDAKKFRLIETFDDKKLAQEWKS